MGLKEKYYTLTSLVQYANENYKKKTGGDFNSQDIESYIRRGYFPQYTGGRMIIKNKGLVEGKVVYKLTEPTENVKKYVKELKKKE